MNHVSTQMQYAAVVMIVSLIGYVLAGIVQIWWVVLGFSLILLLVVLNVMRVIVGRKEKDKA